MSNPPTENSNHKKGNEKRIQNKYFHTSCLVSNIAVESLKFDFHMFVLSFVKCNILRLRIVNSTNALDAKYDQTDFT